jgi:hypothetical protein
LLLPGQELRLIGGVEHVGGEDVAGALLRHALEDALAAGSFDLHGDAGILLLEVLGQSLRDFDVDPGVVDDLAFLGGRLDQLRRDRLRRRRRGGSLPEQHSKCAHCRGSAHSRCGFHDILPDACRPGACSRRPAACLLASIAKS